MLRARVMGTRALVVIGIAAAAASILPAASTPAVAAATSCPRAALALPVGVAGATVAAGDPTGRFQVGAEYVDNASKRPVVWDNGVARVLATSERDAKDINARGEIVGTTPWANGDLKGWVLRGSRMSRLPGLAGKPAIGANAINTAGTVAGFVANAPASGQLSGRRAVVWLYGKAIDLALPAEWPESVATDIDDDGTVVGYVLEQGDVVPRTQAIAWFPDGTWRFLPATKAGLISKATAIRAGRVVGVQADADNEQGEVVQWTARTGSGTVVSKGYDAELNKTTSVGVSDETATLTLVQKGVRRPLPKTGFAASYLAGVTDAEVVYGWLHSSPALPKPVRWNCGT